jgi:hypothetical protein
MKLAIIPNINYSFLSFSVLKALLCTNELKNDSRMLNKTAYQKPSILNPFIKYPVAKMMQALMTNKNKPSVRMVTGKVNIINRGFTVASKIASTIATISAVKISLITIPGSICARINALTAVINILIKNFIPGS